MNRNTASKFFVLLIWIFSIFLWLNRGRWYIPAGLLSLHLIEFFVVGLKTGKDNGKNIIHTVIMTLIFGVAWWGPIRGTK